MYNFRKYLPSFFLHKLTSIYRQNWSCKKIPKSQNSDKASSFSSVVVNIALSVQNVSYSKPLHNKSHWQFKHQEVLTSKSSTLGYSCIFKKFLPWNFGKTPSSLKRLCAALYSPPSMVNITSYSEIKRTSPIAWITKITECAYTNLHYYIMCFKSYHILSWKIITLCIKVFITFCINIITFCISFTFCHITGLISGPGIFLGFAGTALGNF